MKTPPFRTLIVEDHQAFSRFLCSTLEEKTQCQVIGHISDGLEAIEEISQLGPDLIVLDLGLPRMNGMEVARRVSQICPAAKILIVSQEFSSDIVQAALGLGVHGYVLKADAADLPQAVDAVLHGKLFVSSRLNAIGPRSSSAH